MKRVIRVKSPMGITVKATINSRGLGLTYREVERARNGLADALQEIVSNVRYFETWRAQVEVK